jgi:hypothetical protein
MALSQLHSRDTVPLNMRPWLIAILVTLEYVIFVQNNRLGAADFQSTATV